MRAFTAPIYQVDSTLLRTTSRSFLFNNMFDEHFKRMVNQAILSHLQCIQRLHPSFFADWLCIIKPVIVMDSLTKDYADKQNSHAILTTLMKALLSFRVPSGHIFFRVMG